MIRKAGGYKELAVADQNPVEVKESGEEKIPVISGTHYMDKELLDSYDIVFKTPGIVLPEKIENYKCQFVSQTGLFISKFRSQIVGITGTKGKSTTSTLLYHVLKENGEDVVLAGNIGIPVFDIVGRHYSGRGHCTGIILPSAGIYHCFSSYSGASESL